MKRIFSSLVLLVVFWSTMPAVEAAVDVQGVSSGMSEKHGGAAPHKYSWTLDDLINEAVAHYPETLSKRAAFETAKANEDSAYWQFFPSPYVDVTHQNNQRTTVFNAYDNERIGVYGLSSRFGREES